MGRDKTYFVKNWTEALKAEKNDNEKFFALDPIYVSLYSPKWPKIGFFHDYPLFFLNFAL